MNAGIVPAAAEGLVLVMSGALAVGLIRSAPAAPGRAPSCHRDAGRVDILCPDKDRMLAAPETDLDDFIVTVDCARWMRTEPTAHWRG
jgi:hypothetical protein